MSRDLTSELISMLRALPPKLAVAAETGSEAEDGLRLCIPEDPDWRLEMLPTATGWVLHEVRDWPGPLAGQRTELSSGASEQIIAEATRAFTRLQLQRRNAACGTPTGPDGRRSLR